MVLGYGGTGTKMHIQRLLGNEYQVLTGMFVCLFVFLFNRLVCVDTRLGPDGTRCVLLQVWVLWVMAKGYGLGVWVQL